MALESLDSRLGAVTDARRCPPDLVNALATFVRKAPDAELFRVNPISWAAARGFPEESAIDLFVLASRAGIFDLAWGVVCRSCGVYVQRSGALRNLARTSHCGFCRVHMEVALDDAVEASFTVSPAVREIEPPRVDTLEAVRTGFFERFFTRALQRGRLHREIGGAFVLVRQLPAGETTEISFEAKPGGYAIAVPEIHAVGFVPSHEHGSAEQNVDVLDGQVVGATAFPIGPVRLRIRNRSGASVFLALESTAWMETMDWAAHRLVLTPSVSAKRLITNQTFREVYRAESVGADGGLQLRSLAILFTDLTASTELYERVGDLRALELVRRHFELLQEVIAEERGAVVKTIGDAVMASFAEPDRALSAAAAMHRQMRRLDPAEGLTLKIGLHAGPCVAIESNQQLDFFGRTVNIAARVQAQAGAGEVVATDEILGHPGARELAAASFGAIREDLVHLKGIAGDVRVHRMRAG